MKKTLLSVFVIFFFILFTQFSFAENLAQEFRGYILLQVEDNGEAWYVHPDSHLRYFLNRPTDAFAIMNQLGVGILNSDLIKIPISAESTGLDSDQDGLSDLLEDALETDPFSNDSDLDGFNDQEEISANFNPLGAGRLPIDNNFTQNNVGRIFLQVENHGEAWYVNPRDQKRYFLGRPADAFALMQKLSLGISNENLAKISIAESSNQPTSNSYNPIETENESTTWQPLTNRTCNQANFKMAIVLLVRDLNEATDKRLNFLRDAMVALPQRFLESTDGLATMETHDDVIVLQINDEHFLDSGQVDYYKVAQFFYDHHLDEYDFLNLYHAFPSPNSQDIFHFNVQNLVEGIGLPVYRNEDFSKHNQLLGVNAMGSVDDNYIQIKEELNSEENSVETLIHETGHQWCCYAGDPYVGDGGDNRLEIRREDVHYSEAFSAPVSASYLLASPWEPNGDGTFRRTSPQGKMSFHPLTLYFMGVLPQDRYGEEHAVYKIKISGTGDDRTINTGNSTLYKEISVYDVIQVEGERKCVESSPNY